MPDLRSSYDHVIVGGGVAADKAARAIREAAPAASIAILSADADGPVYRPALSKDLWHGDDPDPASQDLATAAETGADLALSTEVTDLDTAARTVTTADGTVVGYGQLLLATGAAPRRLPGVDDPRVAYLRTVADYRHLRELAADGARIAVVGGGYIGSEAAAALSRTGARVTLLHSGTILLDRMFPTSIAQHLAEVFGQHGIELIGGFRLEGIEGIEGAGGGVEDGDAGAAGDGGAGPLILRGADGRTVEADAVVLGIGSVLQTSLAHAAGLALDGDPDAAGNGAAVIVDARLRTSADGVWAAGDIARFDDPLFGHRHVEHVDNAWASGERVGANMAAAAAGNPDAGDDYAYTPLFYSDLFDDGYEAVGRLDASLETVEVWNDARTAAVVHYLDDGKVVGVLLWNTWDSVERAREVIAGSQHGSFGIGDLRAQIAPGD
ncbi:NAD(P)/FAD-dependent oxidoreductase [Brachybacterium sp. DNPG3]